VVGSSQLPERDPLISDGRFGVCPLVVAKGTAAPGAERKLMFEIGRFRFCPTADPPVSRQPGKAELADVRQS